MLLLIQADILGGGGSNILSLLLQISRAQLFRDRATVEKGVHTTVFNQHLTNHPNLLCNSFWDNVKRSHTNFVFALEYLFVPPQKVRNIDCFNLNKSPTGAVTVKKISIIHPNHFITLFI